MISGARFGAPPVRGKGVSSHPPIQSSNPSCQCSLLVQLTSYRPSTIVLNGNTPPPSAFKMSVLSAKRTLARNAAGDKDVREKLLQAWHDAPAKPVLRDMMYAIARQYGFENWRALKQAIESRSTVETITGESEEQQLLVRFFEYACPDHHVRGRPAHRIAHHAALRMLRHHQGIVGANFYSGIVFGVMVEIERILL